MMNYDKAVAEMLSVDGALAAAVVDFSSGMMLAGGGSPAIDRYWKTGFEINHK